MLCAGISWDAIGYQVAIVDRRGQHHEPVRNFSAGDVDSMISFLRGNCQRVIVDSTIGVLTDLLSDAGLPVYRADGWTASERPDLGSISAQTLAEAGLHQESSLVELGANVGALSGRDDDLLEAFKAGLHAVDNKPERFLKRGSRDVKEVAITFDDGPFPPYSGQILDILEYYAVPATFFCIGLNVIAHPGYVDRILHQGCALGNHSWSHPFLPDLSEPQLLEQVNRTDQVISGESGGVSPSLFRPPYGALPSGGCNWLDIKGLTTILWDVDSSDWSRPGVESIAETVIDKVLPGSIVLMHDGGGDRSHTVGSLPLIIEELLTQGYRLVKVEELSV